MVDLQIIRVVRDYLKRLAGKGLDVNFGVIFGSWTKGNAGKWSDIDILVVSPRFDTQKTREDINFLWEIAGMTDVRLEPIPCGVREWEEDDSRIIVEIARREGETILIH